VYITNLPKDVTQKELEERFSRFGVIAEDLKTGEKKIKVYADDQGKPKGDGLIVFFKAESVELAIAMMDMTDMRMGERNSNGEKIRVQKAEFSNKQNNEIGSGNSEDKDSGEKKKISAKEKVKMQRKLRTLNK
jgi:HIV Tat-specific factor 1